MAEITSFARTLGTLLHNGVPMVRSLEVTTHIEPAMIVLVDAVVGFIVVAIVLPIFELGNVVQATHT